MGEAEGGFLKRIQAIEGQLQQYGTQEMPVRQRESETKLNRLLQTSDLPSFGHDLSSKSSSSLELKFRATLRRDLRSIVDAHCLLAYGKGGKDKSNLGLTVVPATDFSEEGHMYDLNSFDYPREHDFEKMMKATKVEDKLRSAMAKVSADPVCTLGNALTPKTARGQASLHDMSGAIRACTMRSKRG